MSLFYRNPVSYGLGVIAMMAMAALFYAFSGFFLGDGFEVVGSQSTTGTVLSIEQTEIKGRFSTTTAYNAQVRLADGRQVNFALAPPYSQPGDTVPVKITRFKDGSTLHTLDLQRHQPWR
ncbi:MAG: hypothetical protein H6970_14775 [Gammaproteobacteria bacterium]|nr:hypothetical protein [Gammaproteobacteria bacterium]MCP5458374.1 hypothetical protein [Gammaproteobacteria bacterium]